MREVQYDGVSRARPASMYALLMATCTGSRALKRRKVGLCIVMADDEPIRRLNSRD